MRCVLQEAALDGAQYIQESARQALLETAPAAREPADMYSSRYQQFARIEIVAALDKYDALAATLGAKNCSTMQ